MRTAVLVLQIVLFASLSAADPLLCIDGCESDGQHSSAPDRESDAAKGDCLMCHGGLSAGLIPVSLIQEHVAVPRDISSAAPHSVPPPQLERPPRLA